MLRPGTVELPEPPEPGVTLAAVAHSVQTDIRRKFAATHEDILQYIDKCEYLFEHDEFYDKSYKALARTVTELNRIGTDAQQQEREQLYNGLIDWLATSSFTVEPPTSGAINEHQLIESGQTTRDVLLRMLLTAERLRALHLTIVDRARSAAEQLSKQTDKTDDKRKLLKMVDESSFVWKTAAAEIVQLLHEERSKGGELVELYADKIRYLMGELEAQSNMIAELRSELDQQIATPVKFHELELKTKQARLHEAAAARLAKQAAGGQKQTISDDDVDDDLMHAAAAVSTLPDFNKQLIATLQKDLEECRRQNASVVARGHEAAARIRFLTDESNRKDKQIAQLQANVVKLRTEIPPATDADSPQAAGRKDSGPQQQRGRRSTGRTKRRGRGVDSIQETGDDDDDDDVSPIKTMRQIIAAAKRQKQPTQGTTSPAGPSSTAAGNASQSTGGESAAAVTGTRTGIEAGRSTAAQTRRDRPIRGQRAARNKVTAADRVAATTTTTTTTAAAASDRPEQTTKRGVPEAPTFDQLGSFWQRTAVKEWAPVDTGVVDTAAVAGGDVKTTATQQKQVHNVDMNEAIEMTKLFMAGSKTAQQQQGTPAKAKQQQQQQQGRESVQHQRKLGAASTHVTPITPQLFTDPSTTATTTKAPPATTQQHQAAAAARPAGMTPSAARPAADGSEPWRQQSQPRARTAADAAKQRAARLSVVLFHSADQPPASAATPPAGLFKPATQQQQQQQPMPTRSKAAATAKPAGGAGYNLVGVNMQNLAQQAKLLEHDSSLPTNLRRF